MYGLLPEVGPASRVDAPAAPPSIMSPTPVIGLLQRGNREAREQVGRLRIVQGIGRPVAIRNCLECERAGRSSNHQLMCSNPGRNRVPVDLRYYVYA